MTGFDKYKHDRKEKLLFHIQTVQDTIANLDSLVLDNITESIAFGDCRKCPIYQTNFCKNYKSLTDCVNKITNYFNLELGE